MKAHLAMIVAASLSVAADAPTPQRKTDNDRLQGTWLVTAGVFGGFPAPPKELRESRTRYVIGKETFSLVEGEAAKTTSTTKYRIDMARSPRTIDLLDAKTGEVVAVGIYKVAGDELQLCLFHGKDEKRRPTEFKAQIKEPITFVIAERVKP
jgi:uncharacterized protein (TIGR03067 family)